MTLLEVGITVAVGVNCFLAGSWWSEGLRGRWDVLWFAATLLVGFVIVPVGLAIGLWEWLRDRKEAVGAVKTELVAIDLNKTDEQCMDELASKAKERWGQEDISAFVKYKAGAIRVRVFSDSPGKNRDFRDGYQVTCDYVVSPLLLRPEPLVWHGDEVFLVGGTEPVGMVISLEESVHEHTGAKEVVLRLVAKVDRSLPPMADGDEFEVRRSNMHIKAAAAQNRQ